ncbi:UV excision repair protein rad23 [Coemansia aciculifera]|nr:UV excision repair protein rad23 [Coemansia aciculifera]
MHITLKTLQQKTFKIDVEPGDSIKTVKQKVEASQGYPTDSQKLIFSGKILLDTQTVEELKISENDFMVVMTVKAKANTANKAAAAATPVSTAPPQPPAVAATPANSVAPPAQVAAPISRRTAAPSSGLSLQAPPDSPSPLARNAAGVTSGSAAPVDHSLLLGEHYQTAVSNMVEMGYTREQCERAMRASFNNPDRAVEYLLNGIPEAALRMADEADARREEAAQQSMEGDDDEDDAEMQDSATTTSATAASTTGAAAGTQSQQAGARPPPSSRASENLFTQAGRLTTPGSAAGMRRQEGLNSLEALRNTPQFRQLQHLVRENPPMLAQVLEQLAHQQPQLMQLIANHEEEFFQMLMEGMSAEEVSAMANSSGLGDGRGGGALPENYIRFTHAEKDAIDRLQALGFPYEVVVQAYFACDKNEDLAANYLFDHGEEYMD